MLPVSSVRCVTSSLAWAALMVLAPPSLAQAASFSHKNWELACDNTGTCRAAGYQDEGGDSEPVSMLITRTAGPGEVPEVRLQVQSDQGYQGPLSLTVGALRLQGLPDDAGKPLPDRRVRELLPALLNADEATVRAGAAQWTLSLAGLKAVLLKMDEAQGRLNTPGALVRRGGKPESGVRVPAPPPEIKAVRPLPARAGDAALRMSIFKLIPKQDLERCNDPDPGVAVVHRLNDREVLLALPCGMGAYNASSLLWQASDKPPHAPRMLDADGDFDPVTGEVHSAMKVRGLGDCWSVRTWQLSRHGFALTSETYDGLCRGFAGGAWQLPRHVTKVTGP